MLFKARKILACMVCICLLAAALPGTGARVVGSGMQPGVALSSVLLDNDFEEEALGKVPNGWSITSSGGTATVVEDESGGKCVKLTKPVKDDGKAVSALKSFGSQTGVLRISYRVKTGESGGWRNSPYIQNSTGNNVISIAFNGPDIVYHNNTSQPELIKDFAPNRWYSVTILADIAAGKYDVYMDGEKLLEQADMRVKTADLDRLFFQLGSDCAGALYFDDVKVEKIMETQAGAGAVNILTADAETEIIKTVKKDGTGHFTSISAALEAITDASETRKYVLVIYPGIYTEKNWSMKPYVSLRGTNRETCIIAGELPDNASDEEIRSTQTFWWNCTGRIENLTITCKNMRYPIHSDAGQTGNKDGVQEIFNCHIEHLGNQGAINYRAAQGLPAGNVWTAEHAWGCGTSDGMKILAKNTTFKSRTSAFYFHTNKNFEKANYIELTNCRLIATNENGRSLTVQALSSHRDDQLVINNSQLTGIIEYTDTPWLDTSLEGQLANHAEIKIVGAGNTSAPFFIDTHGQALKIASNTLTNSSKVRIGGSAAGKIFGNVKCVDGGQGIAGYAIGDIDVSGNPVGINKDTVITKLGQRLGNCTVVPLQLEITVDAYPTITVPFNQDYTNMENGAILSMINGAITGKGVASLRNVGNDYYPEFLDETLYVQNTSSQGILKGMGVAYNTSFKNVRKMTGSDGAEGFAGIALQDIRPGEWGMIQTKGHLLYARVVMDSGEYPEFGEIFGIGATDGKFVKDASTPLLISSMNGYVKIMR